MRRVRRIAYSPVKNFRLQHPERVWVGPHGVSEARRFFLVGPDGERLRSSLTAWPAALEADYDAVSESLRVRFPDGTVFAGSAVATGAELVCKAAGREVVVRVVPGRWDDPLSRRAGHPVQLVRTNEAGAAQTEPVTLVSKASVAELANAAGLARVDARRFRMLFEPDGCRPHEEDEWEGRLLVIGDAVLRAGGPVARCAVTTRDPDTGERDLDALRLIRSYRGAREPDGAILFGVYARVERPGWVRVGDRVSLGDG